MIHAFDLSPKFNARTSGLKLWLLLITMALAGGYACSPKPVMDTALGTVSAPVVQAPPPATATASADPRVGLRAGVFDAEEAISNLRLISTTPPPANFLGVTNSDLAFKGNYAIQGNYNGFIVWDISNPASPEVVIDFLCPASQSDVSVYGDLLFVSGEGLGGRLDCGAEGVSTRVSKDRLRGIRIFDITNIKEPKYIANVQTCRGSHTHSVLEDPNDDENVYIYVSGSAGVRPEEELPGCSQAFPEDDPNSALFRIEVIKVPLDQPEAAHIVNSPRIFEGLVAPPRHGLSPADLEEIEKARQAGAFVAELNGVPRVLPAGFVRQLLNGIVEQRGGSGAPTAADSTFLRENIAEIAAAVFGGGNQRDTERRGPNQCHDITLYPEIGLAGGACEGYGLLLDITDPTAPVRIDAVADSNFAYWHSATFTNDGSKVLFTDEWGGGGQPKCRENDPYEWGGNAIFTIEDGKMNFKSYYKLPAPQTAQENCVAHNGSMIPVPGRDIMVQSWYQGGISVFDWTDAENPHEIAFHDRGPLDAERMQSGGSWSVYWYNGFIVSSEIARGLDIFELVPSEYLSANEIEASKTVKLDYLNAQGQPKYVWPNTFALARAYVDQLERENGLPRATVSGARSALSQAESAPSAQRSQILNNLVREVEGGVRSSSNSEKVQALADALKGLAAGR